MISFKDPAWGSPRKESSVLHRAASLSTTGWFYLFKKIPQEAETHLLSSIGFDFAFCTNLFLVTSNIWKELCLILIQSSDILSRYFQGSETILDTLVFIWPWSLCPQQMNHSKGVPKKESHPGVEEELRETREVERLWCLYKLGKLLKI